MKIRENNIIIYKWNDVIVNIKWNKELNKNECV